MSLDLWTGSPVSPPHTHLQMAAVHSHPLQDLPHAPWTWPSGGDSHTGPRAHLPGPVNPSPEGATESALPCPCPLCPQPQP